MSKYRILEKKGTTFKESCYGQCGKIQCTSNHTEIYIPRFIVQELEYSNREVSYKDLKEFSNLEEARAYKRDLELDEGIVRG